MKYVLTLMANPKNPALTPALAEAVTLMLKAGGAEVGDPLWLQPGVACDIPLGVTDPARVLQAVARLLDGTAVDYALQVASTRVKKMLIADMDSTMIEVECIDELADFMGLKDKIARITEAAMRGELDFKQALRERVAMLAGMDEAVLLDVYKERVTLMAGARALIATMNRAGALTILVSGGFTFFTGRVSGELGFQVNRANILEIIGGKLTGRVLEPIVDSATKLATLREFTEKAGIDTGEVMAVGDGANDIPMIEAAGLGVAYHAKPKTAAAADVALKYSDLTALLYLQGYGQADFA